MMDDRSVFISHASHDAATAQAVCAAWPRHATRQSRSAATQSARRPSVQFVYAQVEPAGV